MEFQINPEMPTLDLRDAIDSRLKSAKAMIHFLDTDDFAEYNDDIRCGYVMALSRNIEELEAFIRGYIDSRKLQNKS